MSARQRNKGKSGELEVVSLVRDLTGWDLRRRVRQHARDSNIEGVPGWVVEVKRHAQAGQGDIARWWLQTAEQAATASALPVLFYRRSPQIRIAKYVKPLPAGATV